jgi:CHAD domain-containing protein
MKGFCITNSESITENIQRILSEQLDDIVMQSDKKGAQVPKAIHEIRKSMKRIRAVLRMIRDEIGYSTYYRENVFYRDLSRKLSDIRNFEVLLGSITALKQELSNTIPSDVFDALLKELDRQQEEVTGGQARLIQLMKNTGREVKTGRERIHDLPIRNNDFSVFEGGIYRVYRQGRNYLSDARKNPSPNRLHDLRKKMKYFWYQVEILEPIFPGPMQAYATTLETIAESLGVYHDFQVLQEFLAQSEIIPDTRISEALQEACIAKKSMLLHHIWPLADMAYSEKPHSLLIRLASYWEIYATSPYEPIN